MRKTIVRTIFKLSMGCGIALMLGAVAFGDFSEAWAQMWIVGMVIMSGGAILALILRFILRVPLKDVQDI